MSMRQSDPVDSIYLGKLAGKLAGGQPRAKRKINYKCPTCGAAPGQSCQRFKAGVEYWEKIKGFHRDRKVTD